MDIGAHCSISSCNQQDFLPFTCDCCHRVFCLNHRTYDTHTCPHAGTRDQRVIQCPLCTQLLHWTAEQDVNYIWEQHLQQGQCQKDESNTKKKPKKLRCGAETCREVLVTSNQYHCIKCNTKVCLRHRFETDHACQVLRQQQRQRLVSSFSQPKSTISSTKRIVQKEKQATVSSSSSEQCPICSQTFPYVSQLITHVNRMHPDDHTRPLNESCPYCSQSFQQVQALITHVETTHRTETRQEQEKCNLQ